MSGLFNQRLIHIDDNIRFHAELTCNDNLFFFDGMQLPKRPHRQDDCIQQDKADCFQLAAFQRLDGKIKRYNKRRRADRSDDNHPVS